MLTKLKSTYADGLMKVIRAGRADSHHLPESGDGDGAAVLHGTQSAEYPGPHGAGQRRYGKCSCPSPAACWWTRITARSSCGCWRISPVTTPCSKAFCRRCGYPHGYGRPGVRRAAGRGHRPCMRRHAKAVNFGIVYGISEFSLAEDIGVSRAMRPGRISTSYLNNYPGCAGIHAQAWWRMPGKSATPTTLYGPPPVSAGAEKQ